MAKDKLLTLLIDQKWRNPEFDLSLWVSVPGAFISGDVIIGNSSLYEFYAKNFRSSESEDDYADELTFATTNLYQDLEEDDSDYVFLDKATVTVGNRLTSVPLARVKISSIAAWGVGRLTFRSNGD